METVSSIDEIRHPIFREVLRQHPVEPNVEIVSIADVPAGTGLGSSGTFTVGLLRAIYAYNREHIPTSALAEEACRIEIELLEQPVGKQDQYIAAFGGLTCFQIDTDGKVTVSPLRIPDSTLHELEDHLLMFFTGYSRQASDLLGEQKKRTEGKDRAMVDNLNYVKKLGISIKEVLEAGDSRKFAALMHEHWLNKKERSKGMSNETINRWYDLGMSNGALGGKLVGAGAGGFLLFFAEDNMALRRAMTKAGLQEFRFHFDFEGSSVIARS